MRLPQVYLLLVAAAAWFPRRAFTQAQTLVNCVNMYNDASCDSNRPRDYLQSSKDTRYCAESANDCIETAFGEFFRIRCSGNTAVVQWYLDSLCSAQFPNTGNGTVLQPPSTCASVSGSTQFFVFAECGVEDNTDRTSAFVVSLVINVVIAAVAFLAFLLLRPHVPRIYMSRVTAGGDDDGKTPNPLTTSMFAWIMTVIRTKDEEFYRLNGLDALVYLLYLRYGLILFLFCFLYGFIILLPINFHGGNSQTGLDRFTLANTKERDSDLWAHFIGAHLFVIFALWLAKKYYRKV